jgi:hypothetical protein
MFKKLKTIATAALILLAGAGAAGAATTRYVEVRPTGTLQPNTTGPASVHVGSGTVKDLFSDTTTVRVNLNVNRITETGSDISNDQVLFSTGGIIKGDSGLTYNPATDVLSATIITASSVTFTTATISTANLSTVAGTITDNSTSTHTGAHSFSSATITNLNTATLKFSGDASTQTTAFVKPGTIISVWIASTTAATSGTTTVPEDDTIPQQSEGIEVISSTFTPKSASSILEISAAIPVSNSAAGTFACALFQDSGANALKVNFSRIAAGVGLNMTSGPWHVASTASQTSFRIRCGNSSAGTTQINSGNASGREYGGASVVELTIREIAQ